MGQAYWIWYPGDMELYFALKQNFSRVERGYGWPAFWKSEGFRNRVAFRRRYQLAEETDFTVFSAAVGHVLVDERKYPFGVRIHCVAGEHQISVHAGRIDAYPAIYVEGDQICSDGSWLAEDYAGEPVPAGCSRYFTDPAQDVSEWPYVSQIFRPEQVTREGNGYLYQFETELTAALALPNDERTTPRRVYCGESREEALDMEHCYYSWTFDPVTGRTPVSALRYAYLPGERTELKAIHRYVDIPCRASFSGNDPQLCRIWDVAAHTFRLCSGIFFIDGVKRDKWLWAGDAYQSLFVNQYLTADADIERRTLLALRGNDPVTMHINTIVDYSMLWLLGVQRHVEYYEDDAFLHQIRPKLESMMQFLLSNCDDRGFIRGRERDWVFIDWADLDKEGAFAAEQMLLYGCCRAMEAMAKRGENAGFEGSEADRWGKLGRELLSEIQTFFWDAELGAFVDSFDSGRRHVSRQTNLLALRYGVAEGAQRQAILQNVILNEKVPPITTPYFAFFELDALGEAGETETLLERMRVYWGGMLSRGAMTFWEEYDLDAPEEEQYDMYGDRFGKSLCHAWAASPIYLIARHLIGLCFEGDRFVIKPRWKLLPDSLHVVLPTRGGAGSVTIDRDGDEFCVTAETGAGIYMDDAGSIELRDGIPVRGSI